MLPPLHAALVLRDVQGRTWQSRLEAVDPYALTVARPFDLPLEDGPTTGSALDVTWTSQTGAYTLPSELSETVREGIVALWVLKPQGEATRAQRRAHFRLPIDGSGTITVAGGTITGSLVDVSEAAVRYRLSPEHAEQLTEGTTVSTVFGVRADVFELWATVLRAWPSTRANGEQAVDVVLVLSLGEPQARELRRSLLNEQVRRRRLSQE
jgi:hypothetical protein